MNGIFFINCNFVESIFVASLSLIFVVGHVGILKVFRDLSPSFLSCFGMFFLITNVILHHFFVGGEDMAFRMSFGMWCV